jgi:hypothetical protein
MGAPESGMQAADQPDANALLDGLRTIKQDDRARHASVLGYWLSIRGGKDTPSLQDLDPLQISDAGPSSILLELIGGGQDAELRHLGEALRDDVAVQRIIDAPGSSVLHCIARKLPIVSISRDFLAFEDSFDRADGPVRCWVTLLPLTSCGAWVDYVYAFVTIGSGDASAAQVPEPAEPEVVEAAPIDEVDQPEMIAETAEAESEAEEVALAEEPAAKAAPAFAKLIDGFANLTGFYGQGIKADPVLKIDLPKAKDVEIQPPAIEPEIVEPPLELNDVVAEPVASEPPAMEPVATEPPADELILAVEVEPEPSQPETAPEPAPIVEGSLQTKLTDVRARADEARLAQLRATSALHEGLSAAYDFAIDAEASPEEYLRLVEAEGMKIQLRAPMAPVVKLAFKGVADDTTIAELETVLAWALKQELPRGTLAQRIEEAGGIDALLTGTKPAN